MILCFKNDCDLWVSDRACTWDPSDLKIKVKLKGCFMVKGSLELYQLHMIFITFLWKLFSCLYYHKKPTRIPRETGSFLPRRSMANQKSLWSSLKVVVLLVQDRQFFGSFVLLSIKWNDLVCKNKCFRVFHLFYNKVEMESLLKV